MGIGNQTYKKKNAHLSICFYMNFDKSSNKTEIVIRVGNGHRNFADYSCCIHISNDRGKSVKEIGIFAHLSRFN